MEKFIHIGMPKTLSSALQSGFFSKNDHIHFLGVGVGTLIDYVNDDLSRVFDSLIPFSSEYYYQTHKDWAARLIRDQIESASGNNKSWVGVSSEWLGFNLTPEMVDPELKIRRLSEVMGDESHIFFIVRSQFSLLKSLYGQLVREGLSLSFEEYCDYLWTFQDRSALIDLFYDVQYERLSRYFNSRKIHVFVLEEYRNSDGTLKVDGEKCLLIEALCEGLGIDYPEDYTLPVVNPTMDRRELFQKLELNRKYRHDFGNLIFEPSNVHRVRAQVAVFSDGLSRDIFSDIRVKRLMLEQSIIKAKESNKTLSFEIPNILRSKLEEKFKESNDRFETLSGVSLPEELGYL